MDETDREIMEKFLQLLDIEKIIFLENLERRLFELGT